MKQTFDVTGMTCAACSARVEKATSKVEGVEAVAVNLLKNRMDVTYDGSEKVQNAICEAVKAAGYGAYPRVDANTTGAPSKSASASPVTDAAAEEKKVKLRLIVSFVFTVPLFYLSMGHMMNWPLPSIFLGHENMMIFAFTQFLLLIPVIFVNFKFFRVGFKTLFHGSPNMDSLIALGSAASTIYGIAAMFRIAYGMGHGDIDYAHMAVMDLYFESAAMILTLITLGKYFEARAKGKTTDAIAKLMDLAPKVATRLNDNGVEEQVDVSTLRVGDILIVKAGEAVPVDGTVLEGSGTVDESVITGESVPVGKHEGDSVTGATLNQAGWFKMRADKVGDDTALAGIIKLVDEATSTKAPIEKIADKIAGIFVPCVIAIAVLTFVIWIFVTQDVSTSISHAISVLVISCPCALGLATPTAIMVGTGRGAQAGILIKSAEALETAHAIKTVVLDKTGTITKGEPSVTDVVPADTSNTDSLKALAGSIESKSEHPLARAIVAWAGPSSDNVSNFQQIDGGVSALINNKAAYAGNASLMASQSISIESLAANAKTLAAQGKTPLYFAYDGKLAGLVAVADTVKPNSACALKELNAMGIESVMLTGDNAQTAQAIQSQVGADKVIAGVLPAGKEQEIRALSEHSCVAMVGDGINDAPALARANVGIAIGAGTDIAIESADVVLMHSDLLDVPAAIQLSRSTMRNIKQNLFWALIYNTICIPVAAGALSFAGITLNPMIAAAAMSCSSVCVVTNALRLRGWKPKFVTPEAQEALSAKERLASEPSKGLPTAQDAVDADIQTVNKDEEIVMEKTLHVEGMMCQHCVAHVKKALEGVEGVSEAVVDLDAGTAVAKLSGEVSDDTLKAAVVDAGYEVTGVN